MEKPLICSQFAWNQFYNYKVKNLKLMSFYGVFLKSEFHGMFLDFVECKIAQKVESPYFCLKRRISTLK